MDKPFENRRKSDCVGFGVNAHSFLGVEDEVIEAETELTMRKEITTDTFHCTVYQSLDI